MVGHLEVGAGGQAHTEGWMQEAELAGIRKCWGRRWSSSWVGGDRRWSSSGGSAGRADGYQEVEGQEKELMGAGGRAEHGGGGQEAKLSLGRGRRQSSGELPWLPGS